jgi:hypothetical protein
MVCYGHYQLSASKKKDGLLVSNNSLNGEQDDIGRITNKRIR